MGLNNAARNVEPQTQSPPVAFADLPEPLEDYFEHVRGDTFTGVFHTKLEQIAHALAHHADVATGCPIVPISRLTSGYHSALLMKQ